MRRLLFLPTSSPATRGVLRAPKSFVASLMLMKICGCSRVPCGWELRGSWTLRGASLCMSSATNLGYVRSHAPPLPHSLPRTVSPPLLVFFSASVSPTHNVRHDVHTHALPPCHVWICFLSQELPHPRPSPPRLPCTPLILMLAGRQGTYIEPCSPVGTGDTPRAGTSKMWSNGT